jgi:hypothetical protein
LFSLISLSSVARVTLELKGVHDKTTGKHWTYTIHDVAPGVRLFAEVTAVFSNKQRLLLALMLVLHHINVAAACLHYVFSV